MSPIPSTAQAFPIPNTSPSPWVNSDLQTQTKVSPSFCASQALNTVTTVIESLSSLFSSLAPYKLRRRRMVCKQEQPEKKMTGFQGGHQSAPRLRIRHPVCVCRIKLPSWARHQTEAPRELVLPEACLSLFRDHLAQT